MLYFLTKHENDLLLLPAPKHLLLNVLDTYSHIMLQNKIIQIPVLKKYINSQNKL